MVITNCSGKPWPGAGDRGAGKNGHAQAGHVGNRGLQLRLDLELRDVALVPGLELEAAENGVGPERPQQHEALVVAGHLLEAVLQLIAVLLHVFQRRGLRRLALVEQDALVLGGRQFVLAQLQHEYDGGQHYDGKHHDSGNRFQGPAQRRLVSVSQAVESPFNEVFETRRVAVRLEDMAGQHRREGQGNHAGDQHGAGQREREFSKQRADQTAHEADGRVDGDQRRGHCDHRRGHLARPVQRRLEARLALLDMPVHVLDDDDGIVDHQPDRQHHGQQRQQIEREPQQQHDQRAADQRQRHGHRGHHGGTQRPQRQENHHQHDQHRLQQRLDDLVDRAVDEF